MKKTLLILTLTLILSQHLQSQSLWDYERCFPCKENPFTIDQILVKSLVESVYNKDNWSYHNESERLDAISVEVYTDSTTTTKIMSIKISQILPTEVFLSLASKDNDNKHLLKSLKDNKIYVMNKYAFEFQDWGNGGKPLLKPYTNPLALVQEKALLANYRTKANSALATIKQLEAIHKKHWYVKKNQFGAIIEEFYDPSKFTKAEIVTYKQLFTKLKSQRKDLQSTFKLSVGNKSIHYDLIKTSDIDNESTIEHFYDASDLTVMGFDN